MIVSTTIDDSGVTVTVDSDGDQGDVYAPEVLDDMLTRASRNAMTLWFARQGSSDDEDAE